LLASLPVCLTIPCDYLYVIASYYDARSIVSSIDYAIVYCLSA
jgi:hypothetical protein